MADILDYIDDSYLVYKRNTKEYKYMSESALGDNDIIPLRRLIVVPKEDASNFHNLSINFNSTRDREPLAVPGDFCKIRLVSRSITIVNTCERTTVVWQTNVYDYKKHLEYNGTSLKDCYMKIIADRENNNLDDVTKPVIKELFNYLIENPGYLANFRKSDYANNYFN